MLVVDTFCLDYVGDWACIWPLLVIEQSPNGVFVVISICLCLSGVRLRGRDVQLAGVATHYVDDNKVCLCVRSDWFLVKRTAFERLETWSHACCLQVQTVWQRLVQC